MDRRRAAGALLALAACIACTTAAPTASNQTALDLYESDASEGCYYNFQHYGEGDRIMTNEPCLNCTCHNRMLMCYLRVCPFTKAIGQDCTVEKRADQCCPIVTCPDVPVDLLTSTSTSSPAEYGTTGLGRLDKYGCSMNGKYFPEGSKVPPSPNKPCEHCYCIRNMTTCVMQECTLHVDGCTPIYHKDVCCPVRYSCDHPEDEIPLLDDMTTTVRPTPGFLLTTTTMPSVTQIPQDCVHDDKIFSDGALIKTEKACEHCYCMKGDIVCVVQECGTPMENEGKNCTSLAPKEGQCCPDTYICEGDNELQTDDITTLLPPRRTGVEGSGYRNEDEYTVQPTVFEPEVEGSGLEGSGQEGSELEGSGDKEGTEKPVSITDEAPEVETSAIPVEKDESDMLITTKTPVFVPISTESSSQDSGKYTTEPDKGQNTVPSEDETTVPSVRETTISSDDMHTPELEKDEKTSAEDEKTETPSELEQKEKLATTIIPESHSSLPDIFVTSAELFDNTEKTTSAESITLKQTDESVTDSSEILEPLATTTEKQESSEIQTVIPLDEKQSKSTTVQLPYDEPVDSEQTHEVTTETLVKLSTTEITDKDSGTTVLTEQDERLSTSTSKYEIPEITSVNPIENEIREEISPIASPGMIPGEGNCLVNGITYGNDSVVPSTNKCQANCKCMSSIVKCDPIMCSGPPENMVNCLPVYDTTETCCPTYICDHGKETIPPQPHSQMSGTESPVTQKTDCIDAECRRKGDDMPSATASPECLAGDCVTETETKDSSECGIEGCGVQPAIDEPSKPEVTKQPEVCLDGNCISPPESCIGDNCQLPVHRDQSCGNDEECDVPHEQICEGPNCGEKIKPPVEESPVCDSKGDCGQSAVPEIPIQTCDGEACKQVPIELPSSEVPQAECSDDSCTKKEITDLENKFGTECKDDTCVPKTPEQPVSEKDNINTELPISQDELGVKVPVIEDDKKHTDLPEVVTELPESSVTNVQETVTEPEKIDVTVLPISQEEAMVTKSSETVGPDVADTMVTESFDSETKSGTESPEVLATASSKIPEKEAEQESATEEPLLEGPVTEQQEIATKAVEIPSVEEQEISSESPKVTTHEPKFNTESPEFSEKPDMSEYPTTESQSEISKSPEIQLSKEHEKTTVLPEPPATESEEFATKVTDISEEEKLKVTESPEIEQIDTVTKVSEGPVPESHEVSTKPSEQLPVTDTQEFVTKGTETTDISEAAIDEATKIPQLLVTETQDKSTELPEATAHEVEKTTEFYEKPEYPATDSEEKVTMVPESEEEKITEAAVTKSQEETSYDSETAISEQKPEAPVTETMKPLREGSVTYPQNLSTGTAETLATEAPESSVFIKEETPQEPEDKIPKAPEETETAVTESKEKVTEIEENVTDALEKEESTVTESEENITEASKEPQAAVTESEEKLTEAPRETEAAVTESEEKLTKSPKEPEATVIESEEKLTEAPKEPETSVTESEEKVTEASKEPEAAVTESVDRVTEPSKEPEAAVTESEDKVTASPEGPETVVNELEEKITEESTTPETAITDFEGKVTVAPPVPIEKTTEAGEPSDLDEKKEQPVIEPHEKTTMVPDELTPVEEQERPESAITEAQKKATEVPDSIISGYVPEEGVTESEVKATFAPETHQPSDEPQTCEKDGGCDVPLTKPCEGKDCDIDTPPKEVPMVCNNKDDCEQNTVTEVPVQTCDGESCKELPVPDDKQESPVTESTEKVTEAPEAPTLDDKQEKPESFVTETQEKVTESSKTPLPESGDKKVTESPAEQGLEVPITESDQPIREGSVTEPKGEATEAPETTISQEQSYPHATDLGEKATESPEVSLLEENQQSTKSTVTEYSEKPTEAPEVPALEEKPEVSEIPVIDLEEKTTKAPDSSDEKQEMPEQHVTEYTEKVTEIPEIPLSEPETEKVNETLVTESAEKPTASAEKTTESPLIDEKQKIPESSVTDLEEKLTDKPLREGSVTESQEFATAVPEITTVVPELPISEQEIEGLVTKSTESPISDDKQNIPESPVTDSVTESEEKFTESPQEQEQPLTEQQVLATIAPALQDDQQTPESHVTESYEMETKTPEVPTKEPTEDQDIRGDQPATEPQEITTKVPEIVTSGEQDILTEAPVSLVTGLQEEHAVSVSTESQEPTTRIQEAPVSEEEQTSMSPKATEAPQEPMSGEQEVPETDQVKPTNAPITDKQDIPQESGTESVEKATEIPITESQEKATSIPEVTEKPYAPEIQEKETEVPKTQEKATETPEIPALGEKHELPSTESQDMASVTLDESVFDEGEKTSKSPVTEFQDRVTEIPEATISEIEPKLPETFVTEAGKPLPEGSATEPQALGTETPEIPTTAPEMPESPLSESQTTETVASATESEVKATVIPEVPVSQEEPQAPETEEKETEIPEVSVTEYQGKATVAPEIPEPQAPVTQENETEPPEIPEASEAPVTEHQEEATEIPKPIIREEQPQAPESEEIATKAPGVPTSEEEQETLVTQPQDKATEGPEVPISGQEPESSEAPVTEAQEQATEASETPASEDQELIIPSATESQEAASKVPDALTTEVPKKEYSETTPYLVELEEHTHKIEDELSSIAPQDITTTRIDEKTSEDTEKPIFIPDMETFSVAPTTAQESLSTEAGSLGSKYGEPSEDQEIPKATTIAPEKTSEKDEEQTSVSDTEDEKYTSAPSTEKSIEGSAPETNAPEEGPLPSRTTTIKPEEEVTTPELFDKFTKPEPKPTEETVAPEVPKPTTTGQLSDDLPMPEDEAGQFPPSGGTGYGQEPDYVEEDQAFGPGTCRYGGKVYVSAQQIPRDDPCDFCFCFRSDIICLQQSCPPPIHGCHEEPISGFCCPRYECPVSMATTLNVTTTTTTTTTTLPPHFLPHAYKGQAQRRGCQIKGHTYKVGEVVRASSGPCLHCTCGGDGQMKCDPKQCTPEPMLRQMIAAAVSAKRRR